MPAPTLTRIRRARRTIVVALATAALLAVGPAAGPAVAAAPELTVKLDQRGTLLGTLAPKAGANNLQLLQADDASALAYWEEYANDEAGTAAVVARVRSRGAGTWGPQLRVPLPSGMRFSHWGVKPIVALPGGRFAMLTGWGPADSGSGHTFELRIWDGTWSAPIQLERAETIRSFVSDAGGRLHLLVMQREPDGGQRWSVMTWSNGQLTTLPLPDQALQAVLGVRGNDVALAYVEMRDGTSSLRLAAMGAGSWGMPQVLDEQVDFSSPEAGIVELRSHGANWYLSWVEASAPTGDMTLSYRYGTDLAAAATSTYQFPRPTTVANLLVSGEQIGFDAAGPFHVRSSLAQCGTFLHRLGGGPGVRIAGPHTVPSATTLPDGTMRISLWGWSPGCELADAAQHRIHVIDGQGSILRRYRFEVMGAQPAMSDEGPHVRFLWTATGGIRTAILQDHDAAANRAVGGTERDTIAGGGGSDTVFGLANGDVIYGNTGSDTLHGGAGNDTVFGGSGRDTVFGGAGADFISTLDGQRDVISCGTGFDRAIVDHLDRVIGCERVTRARRFKL